MMQPEDWIKRGHFERRHMPPSTNTVMNLVVNILKTAKGTRAGVGIPSVVAEGIKVAIRQQQQTDIATQGGQFVCQNRGDPRVLGLAGTVGIPNCLRKTGPLK
jgi:hypothetical protein